MHYRRFRKHASQILSTAKSIHLPCREIGFGRLLSSLSSSLQTEFQPFVGEIERCSKIVKEQISLAGHQEAKIEMNLQALERQAASKSRFGIDSSLAELKKSSKQARQWQIQRSEREASKLHHMAG